MKNTILMILLLLTVSSFAQKNKLEYRSISFTPLLNVYFDNSTGGLALNADVSFNYRKSIITFSTSIGTEYAISILGEATPDSYEQLNILYGKEIGLNKIVYVDLHAGLGYFSWESTSIDRERRGYERLTTIGIPLVTKLRFKTGPRFSLGLQIQANFNSANHIYNAGIILQWNRNKKPSKS